MFCDPKIGHFGHLFGPPKITLFEGPEDLPRTCVYPHGIHPYGALIHQGVTPFWVDLQVPNLGDPKGSKTGDFRPMNHDPKWSKNTW